MAFVERRHDPHSCASAGTLPSSWADLTHLQDLFLGNNSFSGRDIFYISDQADIYQMLLIAAYIDPSVIIGYIQVIILIVAAGTLPSEWAGMKSLSAIDLSCSDKQLTGNTIWMHRLEIPHACFCKCCDTAVDQCKDLYYSLSFNQDS